MRYLEYMLLALLLAAALVLVSHHEEGSKLPPAPVSSPSPLASLPPSPGPSTELPEVIPLGQKLKIYYAQDPTTLKEGWGDLNVYDQDTRIFPQFRAKAQQAAATALAARPDARNCGYIAFGYSDSGSIHVDSGKYVHVLSTSQIEDLARDWLKIPGVNCIFLDMAGQDYAYDSSGKSNSTTAHAAFRVRQLEIQSFLEGLQVTVVWNAWQPQDIPWELFSHNDWYLLEDAQSDKGRGYQRWIYWSMHHPRGARAFAVTTGPYDRASLEAAAVRYGISGIQYKTNEQFENEAQNGSKTRVVVEGVSQALYPTSKTVSAHASAFDNQALRAAVGLQSIRALIVRAAH